LTVFALWEEEPMNKRYRTPSHLLRKDQIAIVLSFGGLDSVSGLPQVFGWPSGISAMLVMVPPDEM